MKYELNGISMPIGGISWSKTTTIKDRFQWLLLYLEGKRILVNPAEMELKDECIRSVLEIKSVLMEVVKDIEISETDVSYIRILTRACNDFLDSIHSDSIPHLIYKKDNYQWADAQFDTSMKNFRKNFKNVIEMIEKRYELKFAVTIPDKY